MNISEQISKKGWTKRWAGSYTFISCSNYGWQYCHSMNDLFGIAFENTLHIHNKGTVSCFMPLDDLDRISKEVARQLLADPSLAEKWLDNIEKITDEILPMMAKMSESVPSWDDYAHFLDLYDAYLPNHVFMKELIDFLPTEITSGSMDKFSQARAHSEPVYSESERFLRSIADAMGEKEKIDPKFLTCMTRDELAKYLKFREIPDIEVLQERYDLSVIFYNNEKEIILVGQDAVQMQKSVTLSKKDDTQGEIKGMSAFKGKARGTCRIILDPHKDNIFDEGDILVTGMTRPEFVQYVKKASAIVTDAGGILCHAAISAREMRKPCIIGTEIATKKLNDGDLVEVDADKGMVRIIEKK